MSICRSEALFSSYKVLIMSNWNNWNFKLILKKTENNYWNCLVLRWWQLNTNVVLLLQGWGCAWWCWVCHPGLTLIHNILYFDFDFDNIHCGDRKSIEWQISLSLEQDVFIETKRETDPFIFTIFSLGICVLSLWCFDVGMNYSSTWYWMHFWRPHLYGRGIRQ